MARVEEGYRRSIIVFNSEKQDVAYVVNYPIDFSPTIKEIFEALGHEPMLGWIEASGDPSYKDGVLSIKNWEDLNGKRIGAPFNQIVKDALTIKEKEYRAVFTTHSRTWLNKSKLRPPKELTTLKVQYSEAAKTTITSATATAHKTSGPTINPDLPVNDTGKTYPDAGEYRPVVEQNGRYFIRVTRKCKAKTGENELCGAVIHGTRQLFKNKVSGEFQSLQKIIFIDGGCSTGMGSSGYMCSVHAPKSIGDEAVAEANAKLVEEIAPVAKPEILNTSKGYKQYAKDLETQIFVANEILKVKEAANKELEAELKRLNATIASLEDKKNAIFTGKNLLAWQQELLELMAEADGNEVQVGAVLKFLIKSKDYLNSL